MSYKIAYFGKFLENNGHVVRLSDGAIIPPNPDNADYAQYLKWVAEGNTPLPADEGTQ